MVKFTGSMDVNSMIKCSEFNSNCKRAAILEHDVECIYLFKLLLSCSVTYLTTILGPIVAPPSPILRVGIELPKIGQKGRDAKHSLKWGGMSKRGKDHKKRGGGKGGGGRGWKMFEMQKVAL